MLNLSLNELKLIAKSKDIKATKVCLKKHVYKIMPDLIKINKTIREIRKENRGEDKIFLFDPEKDHYKPIKSVSAFNNNYIQYESIGDKDKTLTIKTCLDRIRSYLSDIIIDYKTQGEWKIQLTMANNLFYSKDSEETCTLNTKRDNIEIMMSNETDEIIKEFFESLLQRYQDQLEQSMRGSEFVFVSIDILYHDLNKMILNRGRSYIDSPERLKNKKATINPKNNDDKCFQYALTVALNY